MVIGECPKQRQTSAEGDIRAYIAEKPLQIRLRAPDLSLVRYRSAGLAPAMVDRTGLSDGLPLEVPDQLAIGTRFGQGIGRPAER